MSEGTVVQVTPREGTTRCAFCHGALNERDGVTCPSCATRVHGDCVQVRCPTLGCPHVSEREGGTLPADWSARSDDPRPSPPYVVAVLLPLLCFVLNEAGLFPADGTVVPIRPGGTWSWLGQARAAEAQRLFYPLFLWSMAAYVAASRGERRPWIPVGLGGGVLLAAAFSVIYLTLLPLSVFMLVVLGLGFLGLAPWYAFVSYGRAWLRYRRERREGDDDADRGFVPWTAWCVLTSSATAFAIQRMNERWAALPTKSPDCFIATAAARGHARVVGAEPVRFANGRVVPVTRQLRALKAAELALAAFTPRLHRAIRAVYDRLGPPIAARLGRTTGTLAWVLLLPAQALAEVGLRLVFRDAGRLIARTYRSGA